MSRLRALARLLRRGSEEHGAVIVVVAGLLTCVLGLAAYGIDTGGWHQTQAKAQSGADAAALAAADTLATCAANQQTGCSASATTAAASMASNNNLPSNVIPTPCASGATGICVTAPYDGNPYEAEVIVITRSGRVVGNQTPLVSEQSIANGTVTTSTTVTSTTGSGVSTSYQPGTTTTTGSTVWVTTSVGQTTTTGTTTKSLGATLFAGGSGCSGTGLEVEGMNSGTLDGLTSNGTVSFPGSNGGTVSTITYDGSCALSLGSNPTVKSKNTGGGSLPYPLDPRTSQTISCPNSGMNQPGTVTETKSGSNDTYNYSVSSLTFQNGTLNLAGVYCASTINLNGVTLTDTTGAPVTFIANSFGTINSNADVSVVPGAVDGLLVWQTGSNQLTINSSSFLASSATSHYVVFAPSAEIYLNSVAWPSFDSSFLLEGNSLYSSGVGSSTYSNGTATVTTTATVPTTRTITSTSSTIGTITTTKTTTVPVTTTSSSTSTTTGTAPSRLTG
jgi:hypothetical protein